MVAVEYSIACPLGKTIVCHAKHQNDINVLNLYPMFSGSNLNLYILNVTGKL